MDHGEVLLDDVVHGERDVVLVYGELVVQDEPDEQDDGEGDVVLDDVAQVLLGSGFPAGDEGVAQPSPHSNGAERVQARDALRALDEPSLVGVASML